MGLQLTLTTPGGRELIPSPRQPSHLPPRGFPQRVQILFCGHGGKGLLPPPQDSPAKTGTNTVPWPHPPSVPEEKPGFVLFSKTGVSSKSITDHFNLGSRVGTAVQWNEFLL